MIDSPAEPLVAGRIELSYIGDSIDNQCGSFALNVRPRADIQARPRLRKTFALATYSTTAAEQITEKHPPRSREFEGGKTPGSLAPRSMLTTI